ncbi:hypothetical protein EV641_111136 [Rhodococcus sp. SMB37]|nr:hypothetical protein EV641_111136 [Rhodococcus sp. SMB37]
MPSARYLESDVVVLVIPVFLCFWSRVPAITADDRDSLEQHRAQLAAPVKVDILV